MNIAFVNPEYPSISGQDQGGIATYTYSMANACSQFEHHVHVLVKNGTKCRQLDSCVKVHEYYPEPLKNPGRWVKQLVNGDIYWERCYSNGLRNKLLEITLKEKLDIVEIPEYNGLACELVRPIPFPIVIHFHTPTIIVDFFNHKKTTYRQKQWYSFEKKALSKASAYRCPSIALSDKLSKIYNIPNKRISIIRHPFNTESFDKIDKKHDSANIDILFVGRLERRKGAEILLTSIHDILGIDSRIRFTLAGEHSTGEMGNYHDAIERSLTENERKKVYFLGPVKREDIQVLYCRSSILFFPSIFENLPYTLLEAMASGLPVVAARSSGITEIIRHGENGMLFNPDNHSEIIESIGTIINNLDLSASLSKNGYNTVKNDFNPEKSAQNSIAFFLDTIENFGH
jgi:glycosyltransferase involved in cell wall biosynthesis